MDSYATFANDARAFAGGGGGGGGFMPSQPGDHFGGGGAGAAGGGGSAFKRSGGEGGGGGKREVSTLRALTVRQLLVGQQQADDVGGGANPDRISVDGADVHNATLLGRVLSVQEGGQRTTLTLHDGTGSIEVSKWRMDDDGAGGGGGGQPRVQVGQYVRVFGHLRPGRGGGGGGGGGGAGGAGGLAFHAFAVRPVTDHNEVTYHLLQCAFQHGHLARGGAGTGLAGKQPAMHGQQQQPAYGVGAYGAAPAPAPTAAATGTLQDAITAVLSDASVGENGLHVNEVVQRVRAASGAAGGPYASASLADVQAALSALMNEALAYTTVDDSHWKST
jgi:replication factor A2